MKISFGTEGIIELGNGNIYGIGVWENWTARTWAVVIKHYLDARVWRWPRPNALRCPLYIVNSNPASESDSSRD